MAKTVILEEQTLDFSEVSGFGIYTPSFDYVFNFVVGETYHVVWDDEEYVCVAYEIDGLTGVGNAAIAGMGEDTGEPFLIGDGGIVPIATLETDTSHIIGIYQGEEEPNGIVIKDPLGRSITYGEYSKILVNRADGSKTLYSEGEAIDSVDVELNFSDGDMTVDGGQGKFMRSVAISKPETLLPENIIRGVTIAGIEGECIGSGEEKFVTLDLSDGNQEVFPDDGYLLSKVTIKKPEALAPENIAKGIDIAGVVGTFAGGGGDSDMNAIIMRTATTIDSDAESVGDYAFYSYKTLSSVNFYNAANIGASAFGYCGIIKANFPVATTIGSFAFTSNKSLTLASFPAVVSIYNSAFTYCTSLSSVDFPMAKTIDQSAFYCCSALKSFSFPEATIIGSSAFAYCSALTEAYFPKVISVSSGIFRGCSALKSIDFPTLKTVGSYAFTGLSLTSINIPNAITIGSYAFQSCTSLPEVYLPNVLYLGTNCFESCTSLHSVDIPLATYLHSSCFKGCTKLTSVSFPNASIIYDNAFNGCTSLASIYFPNVSSIGGGAFHTCAIQYADFPDAYTIGGAAFYNCKSLISISAPRVQTLSGVNTFYGCTSLISVSFSNLRGSVDTATFYGCTALTQANLGYVNRIRDNCFYNCTSLLNINAPSVSLIEASAFNSCTNLQSINFPLLTSLYSYAFRSCRNLSTVSLPAIKLISGSAFYGCSSLKSVYLLGTTVPTIVTNIFMLTPLSASTYLGYYGSIFVRESMLSKFIANTSWKTYSARFVGLTDDEIAALDASTTE